MPDRTAFSFDRFDHVQLAVPAGAEDTARGGRWLRGGDLVIHLGVEEPFAPARKARPALAVRGLTALAAAPEAAGTAVAWDRELPGRDRFHAHDPFGDRLEFVQAED